MLLAQNRPSSCRQLCYQTVLKHGTGSLEYPVLRHGLVTPLHRKGTYLEQEACQAEVILDADTHLYVHIGVVTDAVARVKGMFSIEATPNGYQQLLSCARSFGRSRIQKEPQR